MERSRIPELDGLRGMAILAVVAWHYCGAIGTLGWLGVDLFFVLSGFLIGGILIDAKGKPDYFRGFYRRRFFRIVPLYAAVFLVGLPLRSHLQLPVMPWHAYAFTANFWIMRHGWGAGRYLDVAWSLSSEEQFYLLLPAIVWATPRRWLLPVISAMMLASILPSWRFFTLRCDGLLFGVFAAVVLRTRLRASLEAHPGIIHGLLTAAGGVLGLSLLRASAPFLSFAASLLFLMAVVAVICNNHSLLAKACRAPWLRWLGKVSYCVYLTHIQLLRLAHSFLIGRFAVVAAAAAVLSLAALSWKYFESPLIEFARRGHLPRGENAFPAPVSVAVE